jgi:hypothetical protein
MIRIRCRRDGEGIKAVARELGIAPNTVPEYRAQIPALSSAAETEAEAARGDVGALLLARRRADSVDAKVTPARIGTYVPQSVDADLVVNDARYVCT